MADTMYMTGNPVPSADPYDRHDNSIALDKAMNLKEDSYVSRNGEVKRTLHWMETAATGVPAIEAAERAEQAADTAGLLAGFYKDVAEGLTNTAVGQYFSTPSTVLFEFMNQYEHMADGSAKFVKSYPSSAAVSDAYERTKDLRRSLPGQKVFAVADPAGFAALSVDDQGVTDAQKLRVGGVRTEPGAGDSFWHLAFHDNAGNVVLGVDKNLETWGGGKKLGGASSGEAADEWRTVSIGKDDSIVLISDSTGAAHYVTKDKAYISQLSQMSPYRHINFSVSGNDALDMQYRIVNDTTTTGATLRSLGAKYAIITSWLNDGYMRTVNREMYAENMRRLIETVKGAGVEPILATQFSIEPDDFALLHGIANEYGIQIIDCARYYRSVGGVATGPFIQGGSVQHPGNRSGGVMWLPMLDFIKTKMPRPATAIKIFRKRAGFTPATDADLLYGGDLAKAKKWKEISVFHFSMVPEGKVDELSQLQYNNETYEWVAQQDEYLRIGSGSPVAFTTYALVEVTLPAGANRLDAVEIDVGTTETATISVRDMLDKPASMPGKVQGMTPTNATYLSKWDKPRGAWKQVGSAGQKIVIEKAALAGLMNGNTMQILVKGASFSIHRLNVRYKGQIGEPVRVKRFEPTTYSNNLVAQPLCGTDAQRSSWKLENPKPIVVPIDVVSAPRKPGTKLPVDGVTTLSIDSTMESSFAVSQLVEGVARKYRLVVWCRYFPKAFLRPEVYPGLDPAQVVDRGMNPSAATVTTDTVDMRTVQCEFWQGPTKPAQGGSIVADFTAMQWRPVYFDYDAIPQTTADVVNFKLSCPDGEIQVATVTVCEVH